MISDAGAALIATVYPIGLLVVTVNRRDLAPNPPTKQWIRLFRAFIETVRGLAIIGAVVSVIGCVIAVSMDVPIRNPWYLFCITASGLVIGISAMFVLQDLGFAAATKIMSLDPRTIARVPRRTLSRSALQPVGTTSGRLAGRRPKRVTRSRR
jgi:hypothetical protein